MSETLPPTEHDQLDDGEPWTGSLHRREAEVILVTDCPHMCPHTGCPHEMAMLARAQVHATLALAAAVRDAAIMTALQ